MVDDLQALSYGISLAIPFIAALCEFVLHLLVARYFIKRGTIISTLVAYTCGLLIMAAMEIWFLNSGRLAAWEVVGLSGVNFILYSAMAFSFFSFVNIGESSVRIRVLRELAAAPEGLDKETLLARYNVDHIIQIRVDRLLTSGEMICCENRYYYTGRPKMLLVAKGSQALQRLLLGKQSLDPTLLIPENE
jgi:hypothetical protein